jgi:hypothetical protein
MGVGSGRVMFSSKINENPVFEFSKGTVNVNKYDNSLVFGLGRSHGIFIEIFVRETTYPT